MKSLVETAAMQLITQLRDAYWIDEAMDSAYGDYQRTIAGESTKFFTADSPQNMEQILQIIELIKAARDRMQSIGYAHAKETIQEQFEAMGLTPEKFEKSTWEEVIDMIYKKPGES